MTLSLSRPIHPGEILAEEYLLPLAMTAGELARDLKLPRTRIERIVKQRVGVSADTALRLARYFGTTAEFWLNLQRAYDLKRLGRAMEAELAAIEPRRAEAA